MQKLGRGQSLSIPSPNKQLIVFYSIGLPGSAEEDGFLVKKCNSANRGKFSWAGVNRPVLAILLGCELPLPVC